MSRTLFRSSLRAFILFTAIAAAPAIAQDKPTLTPADYGQWESLGAGTLSPDGAWLVYGVNRVNRENELRIGDLRADTTIAVPYATRPTFSSDSRWLAYHVGLPERERERLRKENQPVRGKLELRDLRTGEVTVIEAIADFAFSDDGAFLAMRGYSRRGAEHGGVDLVVRDLARGTDTNFGNVADFAWQDDGRLLAMTIDAEARAGNGVQLYDPASGVLRTLVSDTATFTGLTWREGAADLAVLRAVADSMYDKPTHRILAWTGLDGRRTSHHTFDPATNSDFPDDTRIVDVRPLRWADHGRAIFFGIKDWERKPGAELPTVAAEDGGGEGDGGGERESERESERGRRARAESEEEAEPAGVEVWHSHDVDIIPEQKVRANRDRNRNHLAVWHLDGDRFVRLGDELTEDVILVEGGPSRDRDGWQAVRSGADVRARLP